MHPAHCHSATTESAPAIGSTRVAAFKFCCCFPRRVKADYHQPRATNRVEKPLNDPSQHALRIDTLAKNLGLPDLVPLGEIGRIPPEYAIYYDPVLGYGTDFAETHSYSPLANWLIPGRVMLGRYPYVEPSKCSCREQGEEQLRYLLLMGITTFVCLQAEVPPQAELRTGGQAGFLPYKPIATMIKASLAAPQALEMTGTIRNSHLDQFLPSQRSKTDNASTISSAPSRELQFVYSPIQDLGVPSTEQVQGLTADLCLRLKNHENLYIHCWGGRGRAGTIGACLLASLYKIDAEETLRRVQRAFDTRGEDQQSPETLEQRNFVRSFISSI